MTLTREDWIIAEKVFIFLPAIFYLIVWLHESSRGGWRAGHARMWKRPKKWQLITFFVLWSVIALSLAVIFFVQR
jgi:hypothetical protein